ncbi:MAG: CNNM domain-containing protein, partial [Jiangellaceae bacterium]
MSGAAWMLVGAGVLVVLAGVLAMADAALAAFSRARADSLVTAGRRGARRLRRLVEDPAPALNT